MKNREKESNTPNINFILLQSILKKDKLTVIRCLQNHANVNCVYHDWRYVPENTFTDQCHFYNEEKNTPLHFAVLIGDIDIIQFLLTKGANPNAKNNFDNTPLHFASQMGCTDTLQTLLESGANPSTRNYFDRTPANMSKDLRIESIFLQWFEENTEMQKKINVSKNISTQTATKSLLVQQSLLSPKQRPSDLTIIEPASPTPRPNTPKK